jgi:rubredoxin
MAQDLAAIQTTSWACMYCGYVYDETLGAPQNGVPPHTRWSDLPDDWCCPMCGGEKSDFQKV